MGYIGGLGTATQHVAAVRCRRERTKRRLESAKESELTRQTEERGGIFYHHQRQQHGQKASAVLLNEEEQRVQTLSAPARSCVHVMLSTGETATLQVPQYLLWRLCSTVSNTTVNGTTTDYACVEASKPCPNDCSGNGVCVYVDVNNIPLDACVLSSIFCRSQPVRVRHAGKTAAFRVRHRSPVQDLRDTVCTNLEAAASIQRCRQMSCMLASSASPTLWWTHRSSLAPGWWLAVAWLTPRGLPLPWRRGNHIAGRGAA